MLDFHEDIDGNEGVPPDNRLEPVVYFLMYLNHLLYFILKCIVALTAEAL